MRAIARLQEVLPIGRKKAILEEKDLKITPELEGFVPDGFVREDEYWLENPYSMAVIVQHPSKGRMYCVFEPALSEEEQKLLRQMKEEILDNVYRFVTEDDERALLDTFLYLANKHKLDKETAGKLWYYISRDSLRASKITPLFYDIDVEDIHCTGYDKPVFIYHKRYGNIPTNIVFNEEELDEFAIAVAQKQGKDISLANPIVDTVLYDGSRVNITFRDEVSHHGTTFTIRKKKEVITPTQLISWNSMSSLEAAVLWMTLEANGSCLFAGGTAGGKTTAMNAIALFIPPFAKIVSIEDTREITLPHQNWIPGKTSPRADMFELLKAALRQRPDYIIVGEVRGEEARIMFQAMSLGHSALSTVHGENAVRVLNRLTSPPLNVEKSMIASLDIITFHGKYFRGEDEIRRTSGVWEVLVGSDGSISIGDVFTWDPDKDVHIFKRPKELFRKIARRKGWSEEKVWEEIQRRKRLLDYMVEHGIFKLDEFSELIARYYFNKKEVMESLGLEG